MATMFRCGLVPALAILLFVLVMSLRPAGPAEAKGLGVEPRLGAPGTVVTLQTRFPGTPPDHDVTLSLVPQSASGADCATVLAVVTPGVAQVLTASWELSATLTIPHALTCGGEKRPVEPGMYWIEIGGAEIDIPPNSDIDLSRVQFGVPDFSAGTLGAGFSSYVVLDASTVSALEARFPGEPLAADPIRQQLAAPLILTLICPTGCYEDPLAGHDTRIVQAFYYRYLDGEGGVISFDPDGPFYSLDQTVASALSESVIGPIRPTSAEQPAPLTESSPEARDRVPYVIASVAGGLGLALAAFGAGVALGRRLRRRVVG